MSRGNDGILIFRDDQDRQMFLALLAEEVVRSRWNLYDYCLMGNHYHLAIGTPECTLSTGMHRLLSRYVQFFNKRHGRRGHLFEQRFKSLLVEEEAYGLVVSRYIALNPVKAHLCERPEDWKWSSYAARAGFVATPAWLSTAPLMSQFGSDQHSQQKAYRAFVLDGAGLEDDPFKTAVAQLYLGTSGWIDRIQQQLDSDEQSAEHPRAQVHPGRPNLENVIEAVATTFDMTPETVLNGRGTTARMLAAWFSFEEGLVTLRRIAERLNLRSAGGVSRLVSQCRAQLQTDDALRDLATACRGRMRRQPPPSLLAREARFPSARTFHRAASASRR
jgi:REP element-mobilizing transposase RayT